MAPVSLLRAAHLMLCVLFLEDCNTNHIRGFYMRVSEVVIAKLSRISICVWFRNLNPIKPIVLSSTYLHTRYHTEFLRDDFKLLTKSGLGHRGTIFYFCDTEKSMMHLTTYSVKYMTRSPNPLLLPPSLNPPHLHLL